VPGNAAVTTIEQQNATIGADRDYHRAVWAMGVRDGLKKPAEQFRVTEDYDKPWDPKPVLVEHGDGTGHWENPASDIEYLRTQGDPGRNGSRPSDNTRAPTP